MSDEYDLAMQGERKEIAKELERLAARLRGLIVAICEAQEEGGDVALAIDEAGRAVARPANSASVVQYKPCGICTTQSWCETHGCQCYPTEAMCCLDYPRCDCNSPPEPDNAPAVTGLTQQDYDALVRDAMLWRTRSPTGAGGNVKAFVCCEGVGQHAPGCIAQEASP